VTGGGSTVLRRWWVAATLVSLGATALALGLGQLDFMRRAELLANDWFLREVRSKPETSKDIVIIKIDARTFEVQKQDPEINARLGKWPYARKVWATLLEYLAKVGPPRAVVFDISMDQHGDDEEDDRRLFKGIQTAQIPVFFPAGSTDAADAAACLPGVPHPVNRRGVNASVQDPDPPPDKIGENTDVPLTAEQIAESLAFPVHTSGLSLRPLQDPATDRPLRPVPPINRILAVAPGFGLVQPEDDADGVMRRTHFAYRDVCDPKKPSGNAYVTLSVATAADLLGAQDIQLSPGVLRIGSRTFAINSDGSAELDYGGPLSQRYEQVSLIDALNDGQRLIEGKASAFPTAFFKDKVIVIGGVAPGLYDLKSTPFEGSTPGLAKHAAELDSFLSGEFIHDAPAWTEALLSAWGAALVAFFILGSRRVWLQAASVPAALTAGAAFVALMLRDAVHVASFVPLVAVAFSTTGALATKFAFADRERKRMQLMFSRYVAPAVVDQLAAQEQLPQLDGENREITAFFSDIRKFSTFSEKFRDDPKTLVRLLNTYLTRVSGALLRHQGTLDKYIGDAVVCIFGAPLSQTDHAVRACHAALEVQKEVTALRAEYIAQGLPDVYTRIGVNSATMFVGNFGSEQLFNYTAMGDGMNLASRLEGANKAYDTLIMIGPRTYALAKDFIEARELDRARVAGKHEAVAVYELLALKGGLTEAKRRVVALYAEALALYRKAEFEAAAARLAQALEVDPDDGPARILKARCQAYLENPPPMPFEGVANLDK